MISISFPFPAKDMDNQPLSLQEALSAIVASVAYATAQNILESIAVVDAGGHMIAFVRMDLAFPAGIYGAEGKARASALFANSSDALQARDGAGGWLSPPSTLPASPPSVPPNTPTPSVAVPTLPGVAMVWGQGRQPIYAQGAVPIKRKDGTVVGAIGCGGGTGAQDAACAAAGASAIS